MTYTLIGHAAAAGGVSVGATTTPIDSRAGDLGIILSTWDNSSVSPAISDSLGNTWTPRTNYNGTNPGIRLWYCQGLATGASHTASANTNAIDPGICFAVFSGSSASPYDTENGSSGALGANRQPGSITPAQNGELLLTGINVDSAGNSGLSINSGFTILDTVAFSPGYGLALAYLVQSVAAAINPTWTWGTYTGFSNSATNIAAFKGISGPSIPVLDYINGLANNY